MDERLIPEGARAEFLETRFGRLRVLRGGSGMEGERGALPLVLIHGGGYDNAAISWFHLFRERGHEREVIGVDLPGSGGSADAKPVGGPRAMAEVVAEVMELLGLERAVIYGCSMGGDVALNFALHYPEKLAGLVLIGPGGLAPRVGGFLLHTLSWLLSWLLAKLPDWLLHPLMRFGARFAESAQKMAVHDPASLAPELVQEFIREAQQPSGGLTYLRYNQATIGRRGLLNDLSGSVHLIEAPTLFFHGEHDRFIDPAGSIKAASRMPNARVVLVDCGHWAQLERPARFYEETSAFLGELEGGESSRSSRADRH